MPQKKYPYQNLSLKDIKGEKWEDIPGLDGYVQISSFGRVKRCEYERIYKSGAVYLKPEMILKSHVIKSYNQFKGDYNFFLTGKVCISGKIYVMMIARMVYYCFVAPFDLDDSDAWIICKDTDNFNMRPSNLKLVNRSQVQKRMVERKRQRSHFWDMTEEDRRNATEASKKFTTKQVTQYNNKGIKIKTYPSVSEAARSTGIFSTSIGSIASGRYNTAGGFFWAFGNEARLDIEALKKKKREAYLEKHGQKITQYDLSGKRIACYACMKDAVKASGALAYNINKVITGEYKSAKGFFWTKGYGKEMIDLSEYKCGRELTAISLSKAVKQYDLNGHHIQTFSSIKIAAQSTGLGPSTIVSVLKGRRHTAGGYKWEYAKRKNKGA